MLTEYVEEWGGADLGADIRSLVLVRTCKFEMFMRHPNGDGYFIQVRSSEDRSGLEINWRFAEERRYLQLQAWVRSPTW